MNKCPSYKIDCPYALSENAPVPCMASQVQCDTQRNPRSLTRNDIKQEDVNSMIAAMIDTVLKTVHLTDAEQDELWGFLDAPMEKFFGYPDFRNHN